MKNILSLFFALGFIFTYSQDSKETANRFFYELNFKPKQDSTKKDKVIAILDIIKNKSVYKDYTVVAQDSIIKSTVEEMQKTGMHKDMSKFVKMPKFSEKIEKVYPEMKVLYIEKVANGFTPINIGYSEKLKFDWKILNDKEKIGEYTAQKATVDFGGRKWTAWFTTDIPFPDGPYKFHGLPGLIVKIEDADKDYSWILQGNKKVENWEDLSYAEKLMGNSKVTEVSKEKFFKTFNEFKSDPLATARPYLKPEMMSQKIPGSDLTVGEMMKKQEKIYKDFYKSNDNPIEKETRLSVGSVEKVGKVK